MRARRRQALQMTGQARMVLDADDGVPMGRGLERAVARQNPAALRRPEPGGGQAREVRMVVEAPRGGEDRREEKDRARRAPAIPPWCHAFQSLQDSYSMF
jgi:hypothetical protein